MRRNSVDFMVVCAAISALAFNPAAHAQLSLSDATAMLESSSADEVGLALQTMADLGPRAVEPICARIRAGLPPSLLVVAIESLSMLERGTATPTLAMLSRHRNVEVRLAAVQALGRTGGAEAVGAADLALSDADARVRAAAALSLGALNARDRIDRLFAALDRNVLEAGQAIGQLIEEDDLPRLFAYVGRIALDSMTPALQEVFARDNISTRSKTRLIGQLEEMGTPGVRAYLEELADGLPAGPVKDAALASAERILQ